MPPHLEPFSPDLSLIVAFFFSSSFIFPHFCHDFPTVGMQQQQKKKKGRNSCKQKYNFETAIFFLPKVWSNNPKFPVARENKRKRSRFKPYQPFFFGKWSSRTKSPRAGTERGEGTWDWNAAFSHQKKKGKCLSSLVLLHIRTGTQAVDNGVFTVFFLLSFPILFYLKRKKALLFCSDFSPF